MSESFAQLLEESLNETPMVPGAIVTGTVIRIESGHVVVSAGLKSESLIPIEQFYDERGNLVTDARYEDIKDYSGINFPSQIEILRPQEEYSILLKMVKLQLNEPLTDEQFALQQPPGAELKNLDQQHPSQGTDGRSQ